MSHERRATGGKRVELTHEAKLVCSDGMAWDVTLLDVSSGGFRLRHTGADLEIGELVSIASGRGTKANGRIRWKTNVEAGGAFVDLADHFE